MAYSMLSHDDEECPPEGNAANLQNPRVREVFKYLPEWAPKDEASSAPAQDTIICPDVTLNALAQLVALRLDVDRSLISFLDGEDQYVLAEATKSSSLQRGRPARVEDDALMTGMRTMPSGQGMCYAALAKVPKDGILVVPNIHDNEQFCFRPFAQSAPDVRFYAACPVVINDQKVGIVCVIDENPRPAFTSDDINFLSDISTAVADHLEFLRMKKTQNRSVGIVAALDAVMRPGQRNPSFRAKSKNAKPISQQSTSTKVDDDVKTSAIDTQSAAFADRPRSPHDRAGTPTPPSASPFNLSSNFLEYAGNLLVDGFAADGVVFYDAGSRIYTNGMSRRNTGFSSSGWSTSPTEDRATNYDFVRPTDSDSPACEILAVSKGSDEDAAPCCVGYLQEKNLRDLIEMFPSGEVLHLGDIAMTHGGKPEDMSRSSSPDGRYGEAAKCLQQAIPDAESTVFFPMWDHYRERWYAGGFLYSSNAKRLMFGIEDLNFLRAFALVLTGELASRDRERSQNQKETFISMISHELRTPLHGILSNVDLMRDVGLTTFQTTLLDTISACGHSLMDIINHLIDRSTMVSSDDNFKRHHQLAKKHQRAPLRRKTSYDKQEEVDLVLITEEVISALAVEMHLRTEARQGYEAAMMSSNSSEAQDLLPSYAVIVYNIHPQHNWLVKIRKGAFRRLLANLTSNAIKFTREGTISIALHRQDVNDDSLTCTITLEVVDTGEGISNDFLKHHMFQQFKQENNRTIGSGLGLFVVKSMTDELGGQIDVRSNKGAGTYVSISFPCQLVSKEPDLVDGKISDYADPILQQLKEKSHKVTVYFVSSQCDERPDEAKSGLEHSRESLAMVCQNWFGIKVEYSTTLKAGSGIVNIVDESFLDSKSLPVILSEMARDVSWSTSTSSFSSPVIFIGTVNFTAALQRQPHFEAKDNMFSITNPCGPHQLARVLTSCIKHLGIDIEPTEGISVVNQQLEQLNINNEIPAKPDSDPDLVIKNAAFVAQPHILVANTAAAAPALKKAGIKDIPTPSPTVAPQWKVKPHILLVEDNAINMKVLERLCQRLSLTYALAFNGLEAVKLFEADPNTFDIVWMDIMMPVMDGITATKKIREIEKGCGRCEVKDRTRVVALTGLSGEDIESDAEHVGFDAFWTKPVKLDLLKREVERWAVIQGQGHHNQGI